MEAVHGTAPDIAGKDMANPTALLLSGCMMLRHLGMHELGDKIQEAALDVIADGAHRTRDLGGKAGTREFKEAIIANLKD
jgi:isocitrate dehydrogenase (NAD+)